jgi:hypothetical protein
VCRVLLCSFVPSVGAAVAVFLLLPLLLLHFCCLPLFGQKKVGVCVCVRAHVHAVFRLTALSCGHALPFPFLPEHPSLLQLPDSRASVCASHCDLAALDHLTACPPVDQRCCNACCNACLAPGRICWHVQAVAEDLDFGASVSARLHPFRVSLGLCDADGAPLALGRRHLHQRRSSQHVGYWPICCRIRCGDGKLFVLSNSQVCPVMCLVRVQTWLDLPVSLGCICPCHSVAPARVTSFPRMLTPFPSLSPSRPHPPASVLFVCGQLCFSLARFVAEVA